jgi:hypothetical protein
MKQLTEVMRRAANRRSFLKNSMVARGGGDRRSWNLGQRSTCVRSGNQQFNHEQGRYCDPSIPGGSRTDRVEAKSKFTVC